MPARFASASMGAMIIALFLLLPIGYPNLSAAPAPPAPARADSSSAHRSLMSPDDLVGNVYGSVRDADTLQPIPDADIFLLEQSVQRQGMGDVLPTNRGDIVLPDVRRAAMRATSSSEGKFLINFVPTPFPHKAYTIVITAPGYGYFIADSARVLPGAVMSLNVDAKLSKGVNSLFEPGDRAAPLKYRHEMETLTSVPSQEPAGPSSGDDRVAFTIFATREGLVGYTTANGHVIIPRDHFVALPSRRALNANDQTYDFKVGLSYAGRTVEAPVWDVGPWNITDDYWNPSSVRERWQDLSQGMPEAQAAYQTGYNGGLDQFGRTVIVPTAIDLADGTFWDDLGMLNNAWVSVKFLWKPNVVVGDGVYATVDLPVRADPGGTQVAVEPCGAVGNITGGPVGAALNRVFYVWWQVRWDDGVQGWSRESHLGRLDSLLNPGLPLSYDGVSGVKASARTQNGTAGFQYYFPFIGKQRTMVVCPP